MALFSRLNPLQVAMYAVAQLMLVVAEATFHTRIPIGIFFNEMASQAQTAVRYEIDKHNNASETQLLNFKIDKYEHLLDVTDNTHIVTSACAILKRGVFAMMGSTADSNSDVISAYSQALHMPYVTTGALNGERDNTEDDFTFSLSIPYDRAVIDVIRHYRWPTIYYVYDSDFALRRVANTLRALTEPGENHVHVTVLHLFNPNDSYALLRAIDTRQDDHKAVVLDLSTKARYEALFRQIINLGMVRSSYHYLLGTLVMDELDLSGFHFGGMNITGFRLLSNRTGRLRNFQQEWRNLDPVLWPGAGSILSLETALAVDAVSVVIRGLSDVIANDADVVKSTFRRGKFYNNNTEGIQCHTSLLVPWNHGATIASAFRQVDLEGLTGRVQFDSMGVRTNYALEVLEVQQEQSMKRVGVWKSDLGLHMNKNFIESVRSFKRLMSGGDNGTKVITTIEVAPFLMRRNKSEDGRPLIGNDRFEGYCADLAKKIAERLNFDYILKIVDDGKYGSRMSDGTWDGMIGELTTGKAHMAIAPLTNTAERERVADFTKPFMELGISIMIKRPEKQKPSVFSFMEPLSYYIWMCVLFAYTGLSLTMFLVSHFSPFEWQIDDSSGGPSFANDFTLRNCLWFALAALMRQGSDISPRSASGRTTASVWWFFTLILVSSYTANLAAFLTIERTVTPIKSAEELEKQHDIEYGTLKSGSTKTFFEKSPIAVYTRMWVRMSSRPHVFEESVESGVSRVRDSKGKYAFLMESTMNDYHNQRKPCNTMRVGANLDSKGYGIATPIGSDLKKHVNLAVLTLMESGELARMQKKWWYEKGECSVENEKGSQFAVALTLSNVAGVFYILIGGLGMAMIISLIEFFYNYRSENERRKRTFDFAQRVPDSHRWVADEDDCRKQLTHQYGGYMAPNNMIIVHRFNGRVPDSSTEV